MICFPYLLKEYRNRWFLIATAQGKRSLHTLALDRMITVQQLPEQKFIEYGGVAFDRYYEELIGVTRSEKDRPHKVILFVNRENAPYVLTKPLHHSQTLLREDGEGVIIRIDVVLNFELEREILGFGESMRVLAPRQLLTRIRKRLRRSFEQYSLNTADRPSEQGSGS